MAKQIKRPSGKTDKEQKKKTGERASLREFICKSLDIQPDVFSEETLIEVRGRNKITVRGGGRMLSYSPDEIRILIKKGDLSITGKRLFCSSYSKGFLEIDGHINEISFKENSQ